MPRTHSLGMRNHPFPFYDKIADGTKNIEVRHLSGHLSNIKVGDFIKFTLDNQSMTCKVVAIRKYRTYEELLRAEDLNRVVPGVKTIDEALDIYKTFPCYKHVNPNGTPKVAAFEIELVSPEKMI
ncbi:MAG: hypothetical protein COT85_00880 [Chlamydiae bacterium CG10_big_fil_rev_8_21_14_0_10_42_34]|nr:MAG: hypothetical protein COT85_00880 [Chlamydiae bacterium CG10_big_fil_rev_8_21_14_0_10_42_34]